MKRFLHYLLISSLLFTCSEEDEEGENSSSSSDSNSLAFGQLTIQASNLAVSSSLALNSNTVSSCNFTMDNYNASGTCTTPTAVIGHTTVLTAINSQDSSIDAQARIGGTTNYVSSSNEEALINGQEVTFSSNSGFKAYNELWSNYSRQDLYDYLSAELNYEKISFEANGKFITMFLAAYSQPFADWSVMSNCLTDTTRSASSVTQSDLLSDMTFERGDYLFCVKDSASETCSASDFQWLDLDTGSLTSTRPSNPRTHSYLLFDAASCTQDGDRPSLNSNGIRIGASLNTKFKLYADFSHGINSVQWKDSNVAFQDASGNTNENGDSYESPYLLYYYQAESDSSVTEGSGLDMSFDFDASNMVFFDGISDSEFSSKTTEELLAVVFTKHDWLFHKKGQDRVEGFGVSQYSSLSVTPTITISGDRTRPSE